MHLNYHAIQANWELTQLDATWVTVHFDAHQNASHQHKKGGSNQHHGVYRVRLSWLVSATHDSHSGL